MRKRMLPLLTGVCVWMSGYCADAVSPNVAVTQRGMDRMLMVQQRYTADVAAAFYVSFESLIVNALTNQLMAAQALAVYTNGLDAADAEAVAQAVARMGQSANDMLADFLLVQRDRNDAFRSQILLDVQAQVAASAQADVQAFANGLVQNDQTITNQYTIANFAAQALAVADDYTGPVQLVIGTGEVLPGVPTRFEARAYLHTHGSSNQTVTVVSDGAAVYEAQPFDHTKSHHVVRISQYSSTVYIVEWRNFE